MCKKVIKDESLLVIGIKIIIAGLLALVLLETGDEDLPDTGKLF